ncbi:MAG: ABC transporter substrate-binding protein [Paracoccus sp. (in: a-proteobacteria)]|uniref:ABC transporter substrate-binding protein n=1 Tax=Paracoccus sp. TaxID=267 RepID=UPI0039E4DF76
MADGKFLNSVGQQPGRRDVLRLGVAGALGLGLTGAAGGRVWAQAAAPSTGGQLIIAASGNSGDSLDPNSLTYSSTRINQICETLTVQSTDPRGYDHVVAEEVVMENPSKWIIRLRQGITFHDGRPVTADDLIFTLNNAIKSPGSTNATLLNAVDPAGIKKLDDRSVQLDLKRPDSMLDLALWRLFIIPQDFNKENPIGTGPFKFKSFTPGSRSEFVRNENYWKAGQPYLDSLVTLSIQDPSAQVNGLLAGQADIVTRLDTRLLALVERRPDFHVSEYTSGATLQINMNTAIAPLGDLRVRQALKMLMDREGIVKQAFSGHATAGNDMFAPLDPYRDNSIKPLDHDPDKALAMLKEADALGAEFIIDTNNGFPNQVNLANVIGQQWKAHGLNVTVRNLDEATFYGPEYKTRQLSSSYWPGHTISSLVLLTRLPDSPFNATGWVDEDFTRIFEAARAEASREKRQELMSELQRIEVERGPVLVPVNPKAVDAFSPHTAGMTEQPFTLRPDYASLRRVG